MHHFLTMFRPNLNQLGLPKKYIILWCRIYKQKRLPLANTRLIFDSSRPYRKIGQWNSAKKKPAAHVTDEAWGQRTTSWKWKLNKPKVPYHSEEVERWHNYSTHHQPDLKCSTGEIDFGLLSNLCLCWNILEAIWFSIGYNAQATRKSRVNNESAGISG